MWSAVAGLGGGESAGPIVNFGRAAHATIRTLERRLSYRPTRPPSVYRRWWGLGGYPGLLPYGQGAVADLLVLVSDPQAASHDPIVSDSCCMKIDASLAFGPFY